MKRTKAIQYKTKYYFKRPRITTVIKLINTQSICFQELNQRNAKIQNEKRGRLADSK